jgi:hypothetical protein
MTAVKRKENVLIGLLGTVNGRQPSPNPTLGIAEREVDPMAAMVNPQIPRLVVGHLQRFVGERPGDQDRVGTGDGNLFACDARYVLAQVFGVVDSNRCDNTNFGVHHVGGIETPSETDLEHCCVHGLVSEEGKGRCGGQLEVGVWLPPTVLAQVGEYGYVGHRQGELLLGGESTVDRKSLLHPLEMR